MLPILPALATITADGLKPFRRQLCRSCPGIATAAVLALGLNHAVRAQTPYKLSWSDEFNGAIGTPPDPAKWKFQTGVGAAIAGNDEAEVYCEPGNAAPPPCKANVPNTYEDGRGHLVIVAVRTDQTVTAGPKKTVSPVYTSGRLNTVPTFQYGRIEASIRMPLAQKGVWPAFWAMGTSSDTIHWPATGEIDVLEQWNPVIGQPDKIDALTNRGSIHGPKTSGSSEGFIDRDGTYEFLTPPSDGLHQYAIDWSPGEVDFYIDGTLYERQAAATMTGGEIWEQDNEPFQLLLNLAMGGGFFGYPDASTGATPTMVVDYVRVYTQAEGALPTGWGNADIGGPAQPGSAAANNGVTTLSGGGAGIAGHVDQFHFAYKPMASDGEVTAHVIDQTAKNPQAKAGVMLRDGRGSSAPFAMSFVSPDGSVHFRYRAKAGDVPSDVVYKGPATWLKVNRQGDVFTGYVSADGKKWTASGNARIPMRTDLLAGLAATSRDNGTPNVVRFDYIDLVKTDAAFDGEPATVPGFVQAENFDDGGAGYTYSADVKSSGSNPFRAGEALSVGEIHPDRAANQPGGYYLSHLAGSCYINYVIQVQKAGDYEVMVRAASAGKGGSFHFNVDQIAQQGPVQVPDTGGDQSWKMVSAGVVHLAAGRHVLAMVTDSGGSHGAGNFDYFTLQSH